MNDHEETPWLEIAQSVGMTLLMLLEGLLMLVGAFLSLLHPESRD